MSNKTTTRPIPVEAAGYRITGSPAAVLIHVPLPSTSAILQQIGQISVGWAAFEHVLDRAIWHLSGLPPKEAADTITKSLVGHGRRFKEIGSRWNALASSKASLSAWHALEQAATPVSFRRNRVVHDAWFLEKDNKTPAQWRAMPKHDPQFGMIAIAPSDLDMLINDIEDLKVQASHLLGQLL